MTEKQKATRMLTTARLWFKLKRRGVRKPFIVIQEARKARIPVAVALAMLEKETGIPQRNIFGCDYGAGRAFCLERVTRNKVKLLLDNGVANGVGWTQLTYPPYVREANRDGGAHKPRYQCRVGFGVLRELYRQEGTWWGAYRRYNGSGAAANAYADQAVRYEERWRERLGGLANE